MANEDDESEVNSFIGSILNIKTKPTPEGIGSCIIGTLAKVDQENGKIALHDVVKDGEMMGNLILSTADIGDLQVCGRSTIATPPPASAPVVQRSPPKPLKENVPQNISKPQVQVKKSDQPSQQQQPKTTRSQITTSKPTPIAATTKPPTSTTADDSVVSANGHALMNMFTNLKLPTTPTFKDDLMSQSPTKQQQNDPKVVYKASPMEQHYFTNSRKSGTRLAFQNVLHHQNQPNSSSGAGSMPKTPRKDQNATGNTGTAAGTGTSNNHMKKVPQNGGSKLVAMINSTTFDEMTNDEIRSQEFDFQKNNTLFEKLPVNKAPTKKPPPSKLRHEPANFTNEDTTLKFTRRVDSIQLRGLPTQKYFVTSTGVSVPAVEQLLKNSIMQLATKLGITMGRIVEIMGRSITQVCFTSFIGDSFRFSPEREADRPRILFICSTNTWQDAATIAAARILATHGVHTYLYVAKGKEKIPVVDLELKLYGLCSQPFSQDIGSFRGEGYDIVVTNQMDAKLDQNNFSFFKNKTLILVDPPLAQYNTLFTSCARIQLITPILPLEYDYRGKMKLYLVNLGIPQRIYEENNVMYKSPFADQLVIPLFPPM